MAIAHPFFDSDHFAEEDVLDFSDEPDRSPNETSAGLRRRLRELLSRPTGRMLPETGAERAELVIRVVVAAVADRFLESIRSHRRYLAIVSSVVSMVSLALTAMGPFLTDLFFILLLLIATCGGGLLVLAATVAIFQLGKLRTRILGSLQQSEDIAVKAQRVVEDLNLPTSYLSGIRFAFDLVRDPAAVLSSYSTASQEVRSLLKDLNSVAVDVPVTPSGLRESGLVAPRMAGEKLGPLDPDFFLQIERKRRGRGGQMSLQAIADAVANSIFHHVVALLVSQARPESAASFTAEFAPDGGLREATAANRMIDWLALNGIEYDASLLSLLDALASVLETPFDLKDFDMIRPLPAQENEFGGSLPLASALARAKAGDEVQQALISAVHFASQGRIEDQLWCLEFAAKRGNVEAMLDAGVVAGELGLLDQSEHWTRKAAEAGDPLAMHNLGIMAWEAGDPEEAKGWLIRSTEGGNADSFAALEQIASELGDASGARVWAAEGALADNPRCLLVHAMNLGVGDDRMIPVAMPFMERAALLGLPEAMLKLGIMHHKLGDNAAAMHWVEKGASAGNVDAMAIAGVLQNLLGNSAEARSWLQMATAEGHQKASEMLTELK
jgi:TPR repeat protein